MANDWRKVEFVVVESPDNKSLIIRRQDTVLYALLVHVLGQLAFLIVRILEVIRYTFLNVPRARRHRLLRSFVRSTVHAVFISITPPTLLVFGPLRTATASGNCVRGGGAVEI